MHTVRLAIELLRRIPRRPYKITAQQLHAQLLDAGIERDLRSIQRHLQMLCEHFDIDCDDSTKPYGYCWQERARGLSALGLNPQESLLLSLAQLHLRNLLPTKVMGSLDSFFEQARHNLLHGDHAALEKQWLSKVRVVSTTQPLLPPRIEAEVFKAVSDALYANRWLEISYRNRAGKEIDAKVMPLGLAQQGVQLYLVCRFEGYQDDRSLALHRFIHARSTTLTFQRPNDFDLARYDNDGRFGYGRGKRIRLSFHIEREAGLHLLEARIAEDQEVTETDSGFLISASVVESEQLHWWLRSFGEDVSQVQTFLLKDEG